MSPKGSSLYSIVIPVIIFILAIIRIRNKLIVVIIATYMCMYLSTISDILYVYNKSIRDLVENTILYAFVIYIK